MTTKKLILTAIALGFIMTQGAAQDIKNYVGAWAKAGYANLLDNKFNVEPFGLSSKGGAGLGVGLGYELEVNSFIFQTGFELDWKYSKSKLDNFTFTRNMLEPYQTITYQYDFTDMAEARNVGYLSLPIMLGAQFGRYFFLAGGKVGLNTFASYRTKGDVGVTGYDERLSGSITDVEIHGFTTYAINQKAKIALKPNFSLGAEFGVDLDEWLMPKPRRYQRGQTRKKTFKELVHYRASVFAEYGLNNTNDYQTNLADYPSTVDADGALVSFTPASTQITAVNPTLATSGAKNASLNQLFVGLKFAVMYEIEKPRKPAPKPPVRPQPTKKPPVKPTPEYYLCGIVSDLETGEKLEAKVEIYNETEEVLLFDGLSNSQGVFASKIKAGNYVSYVTREGYIPSNTKLAFTKDTLHIQLAPIKQGLSIVLSNMFFATGKTTILPESETALNDLYLFLQNNAEVRLRIVGHTDSVGSERSNLILSEGRAKSVVEEMIKRGISADRLLYEGKGESEPIDTNDTEVGRANNRRVEIQVL